jgi:glycosyltransferase involved in cell wall biosynthesis
MSPEQEMLYAHAAIGKTAGRVAFLGHLPHDELAPLLGAADLSLIPSVFPEAYGLSVIEGMAAGALPVATYQSGLTAPLDIVTLTIKDPVIRGITPGVDLTTALAETIVHCLEMYPTEDMSFRDKLHNVAKKRFSWDKTAEEYIMLFKEV